MPTICSLHTGPLLYWANSNVQKRLVRASLSLLHVFCTTMTPLWSININLNLYLFIYLFIYWPPLKGCGILVPWSEMKPVPLAVETQSLNHWTAREVPQHPLLKPNSYSISSPTSFLATPTHFNHFLPCTSTELTSICFTLFGNSNPLRVRMPSSFSVLSNTIVRRCQPIQKYLLSHLLTIYP